MNVHKALLAVAIALPGYVHAGGFSSDQLCKAAIAMEMGRPADTMKTMRRGDMPEISYRRPDGDRFGYRCKVVGDRIIWSAFFTDTASWGRWREGEWDAALTFQVAGETLYVTSSETGLTQTFTKTDF